MELYQVASVTLMSEFIQPPAVPHGANFKLSITTWPAPTPTLKNDPS